MSLSFFHSSPKVIRASIACASFVAAISLTTNVYAAPNANDAAAAEALFSEGKRLMSAGQFAAACPKFAESQRLDPGIGTMLWLGECYGKNGQTASSWAIFHDAEGLAAKTKDPRAGVAREEAAKLESKLSKIVIDVALVGTTQGLEIKRDGVMLGKPLWGVPIPLDPGEHSITASAPQKKTWNGKVTVPATPGTPVYIKIPELEAAPDEPPPPPTPPAKSESPAEDPHTGRGQRILGLVAAGIGLAGIGVGSYFGLQVKSKNDASKDNCNIGGDPNKCNQEGVNARNDALSNATISNIGFIAGGVLLVGGAVLFFTAPSASSSTPSGSALRLQTVGIRPTLGGAALQGTF